MRSAVEIVEAFLHGLRVSDPGVASLAPDLVIEGRPVGAGAGSLLSRLSGVVEGVRVERHIADGPYVATVLSLDTIAGEVEAVVCFRLANGMIQEIRPFFGARGGERR